MTIPVTVRLDEAVAERITALADDLDRSVSWVVGQAVQLYLQGRPGTIPPLPDGVEGFTYRLDARFTIAPFDTADQLAHIIGERAVAWLRQQGAAEAYLNEVSGVRPLDAQRLHRWPDPTDPVEGLHEAAALERARAAAAAAKADPSRLRPFSEVKAELDAHRSEQDVLLDSDVTRFAQS